MATRDDISELERILGFPFDQSHLYLLALTHSSFANEQKGEAKQQHNERLELLGDSVLGLCITEYLFLRFPQRNEGELSKLKSYIVSAESLAEAGREHSLGRFIRLGKGESQDGGEDKDSLLANVLEALIGAGYLDQGLARARELVLFLLAGQLKRYQDGGHSPQDVKLRLQEHVQKYYKNLPEYKTTEILLESLSEPVLGPEQGREQFECRTGKKERNTPLSSGFEAKLYINKEYISSGRGRNKKQAEKQAAEQALEYIQAKKKEEMNNL
ncbi:ribonuclease III [Candidatus Haliotispira prima]|uniref:Ribonuclease 3 n=1 Tax=Candidatus Haliotispira prima TaxID=3034016 RepID=A0ABY8MHE6_9SPIO|nr:ribonuclease III [Candidatus Haliotispira prima]